MSAALMVGRAAIGICRGYLNRVLIDMIAVDMMQMAIMQVVDVVTVAHGRMPA
jgi:hypothetical protein